jgi:hypothetical protein
MSFHVLTYNLKRMMAILGAQPLATRASAILRSFTPK